MLLGLWQLGLAIWILTIPDWSALRVALWSYALLATFYGGLLAVTVATPRGQVLPWDLTGAGRPSVAFGGDYRKEGANVTAAPEGVLQELVIGNFSPAQQAKKADST